MISKIKEVPFEVDQLHIPRCSMELWYIYRNIYHKNQPFMEGLNIPFVPWIRHGIYRSMLHGTDIYLPHEWLTSMGSMYASVQHGSTRKLS